MKNLVSCSIFCLLGLSACGGGPDASSVGVDTTEVTTSFSVALKTDLPACAGTKIGQLAYVEESGEFWVCKTSGWQTVSLKGEKGDSGAAGAVGATGATGAAGSGLAISSGFSCGRVSGGLYFGFKVTTFSGGDVWVECEIGGSSVQASSSSFFKSSQTGAQTGACIVTYDSESPSTSGYWTFRMDGTKRATYTDSGSSINGAVETFAAGECTTF